MNITYNGQSPEDYHCSLATRPVITPSEVSRDRYSIPGRTGELLGQYEIRENARISFMLHQVSDTYDLNSASAWLREYGHDLILSTEPDYKYEVVGSKVTAYESKVDNYRRIAVEMEVYPFKYLIDSGHFNVAESTLETYEITCDTCEPDIGISYISTQDSETITINGNTFVVFLPPAIINIYTRKKIAVDSNNNSMETYINGNYDDLKLYRGVNTIQTSSGIRLTVYPREGYFV